MKKILFLCILFPTTLLFGQRDSISAKARLEIVTMPDSASVFLNDSLIGVSPLIYEESFHGAKKIRITRSEYRDWNSRIAPKDGDTLQITVKLLTAYSVLQLSSNAGPGELWIDSTLVKLDTTRTLKMRYGEHTLYAKDTAKVAWPAKRIEYFQPETYYAVKLDLGQHILTPTLGSIIFPGLGHLIDRDRKNALFYGLTFSGAVVLAYSAEMFYQKKKDEYYAALNPYADEAYPGQYYLAKHIKRNQMNGLYTLRNSLLAVAGAIYLYSLYDVIVNHSLSHSIDVSRVRQINSTDNLEVIFTIRKSL